MKIRRSPRRCAKPHSTRSSSLSSPDAARARRGGHRPIRGVRHAALRRRPPVRRRARTGALGAGAAHPAAAALVIADPEYNYSVPGPLRTRSIGCRARGRCRGAGAASISCRRRRRDRRNPRAVADAHPLEGCGAMVFPDMFALAHADKAFADDGSLVDAAMANRFANRSWDSIGWRRRWRRCAAAKRTARRASGSGNRRALEGERRPGTRRRATEMMMRNPRRTATRSRRLSVRRVLPAVERAWSGRSSSSITWGRPTSTPGHGHRRAAASAHRPRDGDVPVRGRDHASRQPRLGAADPPGRRELDDRRARHRALRAHAARACARPARALARHPDRGWRCRRARGGRAALRALRTAETPPERRAAGASCA